MPFRFGMRYFAGVPFRSGEALWVLAIHRRRDRDYFSEEELGRLSSLKDRLTEVATMSRAVGGRSIAGMTGALTYVSQPAIVISRLGKVLELNEPAMSMVGKTFDLSHGQIILCDQAATKAYADLVDRIRSAPAAGALGASPIIVREG